MRRLDLSLGLTAIMGVAVLVWLVASAPRGTTPADVQDSAEADALSRMQRLLPRDAIAPIYRPRFVSAARSSLRSDELVLGVAIGGEAKAYPITILHGREMVNDTIGGVPILATW